MLADYVTVRREFEKYGIELTEEQYNKFDRYAEYLVEYNEKVNLTAITGPHEILTKHFIDSVLILKYAEIPENSRLIDVGTGAGFPSVPLKIMRPDIEITLLDSLAKRIKFLENLCTLIGIEAEYIHGRAEDIAKLPEYREQYDVSCARAVAALGVLSEYCIPFVKPDGRFLSMKGGSENIDSAERAVNILGGRIENIIDYTLETDSRRIVVIRKESPTPPKYPRNSGQIKKRAL